MASQEVLHPGESFRRVEGSAAVASAVHDFEFDRSLDAAVRAVHFVGLVNGHLRILVSVEQEQWRIAAIDMKERTCQTREVHNVRGLPTEQQLQSGDPNFQAVRRRLRQDGGQIRRAIEADDPLNPRTLRVVVSDFSFQFAMSIRHTNQGS